MQPASAENLIDTEPMDTCDCLQCFPSAIRFTELMSVAYAEIAADQPLHANAWDMNRLVQQEFPDRDAYLQMAFETAYDRALQQAQQQAGVPADCRGTSIAALTLQMEMVTSPWTCEIHMREVARRMMPCDDLYLAVLAHELAHVQDCRARAPGAGFSRADRARSEAHAYQVETDVLRTLYQRRWNQCVDRRPPGSPRVAFADLDDSLDYLQRALDYERDNPLQSYDPNPRPPACFPACFETPE